VSLIEKCRKTSVDIVDFFLYNIALLEDNSAHDQINIIKKARVRMMFAKLMCKMGIGAAKIDLVLHRSAYCPGELIKGEYELIGGKVDQKLKRIETDLLQYNEKTECSSILHQNTILSSSIMKAGEQRKIQFACRLADTFPPSKEGISYKFVTRLIFEEGMHRKDHDSFQIILD